MSVRTLLLAIAAAWACGGSFGQMPGSGGLGAFDKLLQNGRVQKELNLTPEQVTKVAQRVVEIHDKHKEELKKVASAPPRERQGTRAAINEAQSEAALASVKDILHPDQIKRLQEIHVQLRGAAALNEPRIEQALKITVDQKTRIRRIREESARHAQQFLEQIHPTSLQDAMQKIAAYRKDTLEKALAILTPEQRQLYKDLVGEPFDVTPAEPVLWPADKGTAKPGKP
jgi:Spy/CpxP family protein refolding chaperone